MEKIPNKNTQITYILMIKKRKWNLKMGIGDDSPLKRSK